MDNAAIITKFYQSFVDKNVEGMISCYHDDVQFTDPAFGTIKGEQAKMMWKMLIERGGENMSVSFDNVQADGNTASASWQADYKYGSKKRPVHNEVEAKFTIKDGKIIKHIDDFNLHGWAKQALGFSGALLGGTAFFRKKIQKTTNGLLSKYMAKQ